jgi:16S rRNA (adenine1518-N6/adenine1519-N6)-dimethyltransferase
MGIALKKRWGQNFLINRGAREKILSLLEPKPGEIVWEIGGGLGAMTGALLERGARAVCFEIDRGLCRCLEESFGNDPGFFLVPGDFMKTWRETARREAPEKIVGNLPYRSASLMIASLAESGVEPVVMVFTVQKELAERILARPATKEYSSFSVLCQAAFEVTGRGDLQPGSFFPAPEVVSSIVELRPRHGGPKISDRALLSELARALFSSRRKTLRNNVLASDLCRRFSEDGVLAALKEEGIDQSMRAEELGWQIFVLLAERLRESRAP